MNTQAQIINYTPASFIEQAQSDADQKTHDLTMATMDMAALYYLMETRAFVSANYGELKSAHIRMGDILNHMEQVELAKTRAA